MEVKKTVDSGKTVISLIGEVDSSNAAQFEDDLKAAVAGETEAVLDLAELEYVSSAGLRVFLMVQKMFGSRNNLTVIHVNEEVAAIFKVTGFSRLLNIK